MLSIQYYQHISNTYHKYHHMILYFMGPHKDILTNGKPWSINMIIIYCAFNDENDYSSQ